MNRRHRRAKLERARAHQAASRARNRQDPDRQATAAGIPPKAPRKLRRLAQLRRRPRTAAR